MKEPPLRLISTHGSQGDNELDFEQIQRALQGDREAFGALFRCYGPTVRHAVAARVARMPGLRVDLDELVQSVWFQLLRDPKRLQNYDPTRGSFSSFIRIAAAQVAWRLVQPRSNRPAVVYQDIPERGDPDRLERRLWARGDLERLWEKIAPTLNETELRLFDAVLVQGQKIKDVAKQVGKKEAAVYKQCDRMKLKIITLARRLLADDRSPPEPRTDDGSARFVQLLVVLLWIQLMLTAL